MAPSALSGPVAAARTALDLGGGTARAVLALTRSGVVRPMGPDRLFGVGRAVYRYGYSVTAAFAVGAARHPYRLAIVDDDGVLTYAELDERTGIRDLVRGEPARFAVPRDVVFLDELPRNQTGKVLRAELPDRV